MLIFNGVKKVITEIKKKNVLYFPNIDAGKPSLLEYWTLAKEYHHRVLAMRREFGVKEQPRLLLDRNNRI